MKRTFFIAITIIILFTAGIAYGLFRYRDGLRQQRLNAKAPEQQLTIIEGWTNKDIAQAVADKNLMTSADFLAAEKIFNPPDYPVLSSKPQTADLEGFLFPDTYRVAQYPGESTTTQANTIIKKLLDNFTDKFTPRMAQDAKARGYSVYQIVTLASIIEKETGRNATTAAQKTALDDERKMIAGIFYNRLNAGMPLQSDATVNFITGKNDPAASTADTQIDSPYNTYKYKGLPPGPICNPSLSSLLAAVYPTSSDYFYFLHAQPSGQVFYSKTYDEQLANKQKYLK